MSSPEDAERALADDVAALQAKYAWGVNSGVMSAPCQVLVNGVPCGRKFNEGRADGVDGDHGDHPYSPVPLRSKPSQPGRYARMEHTPARIVTATYDEPTIESIEASERPVIHVDDAEMAAAKRHHVDELLDFANEQKERADALEAQAKRKPWWRFWA